MPEKSKQPLKTYVPCDDGETYLIDTIEFEGKLWLVPKWLESTYPSTRKSARIIQLPSERLQDLGHNFLGTGVEVRKLNDLMPKAVLDGTSQSGWPLAVQEAPDLVIRNR